MVDIVNLDTVLQGTTEAFVGALKKLGVDSRALIEVIEKGKFSNSHYHNLMKLQDESVRIFDLAGTLATLLLIRDYGSVVE